MELFINKIIGSIMQIILFALIPFIWWLITARKKQKFAKWIGLKKAEGGKTTILLTAAVTIAFIILGAFMLYVVRDLETAASEFTGLGAKAIPAILVYAIFNTSFPEELIFRGFLLKRMENKFGFGIANTVQAVLFGLMHGVMFFSVAGMIKAIVITVFTAVIAWFMGYINEKKAGGSIIPSWVIHALANIFSGLCAAFSLF